jgi:hypothetical protein
MTKPNAIKKFKREVLPHLGDSIPARHFAWDGFVTALHDNGDISNHQRSVWVTPLFVLR